MDTSVHFYTGGPGLLYFAKSKQTEGESKRKRKLFLSPRGAPLSGNSGSDTVIGLCRVQVYVTLHNVSRFKGVTSAGY